jgi:predicted small secreted protein
MYARPEAAISPQLSFKSKENNMNKIIMMSIAVAMLLSGCNTVTGIGKDFEKLGEKVQDASKK